MSVAPAVVAESESSRVRCTHANNDEDGVRKLISGLVLLAACHTAAPVTRSTPVTSGNQVGAADPASAVRSFLAAVKQQDLQAMSNLWGGPNGLARDQLGRQELEKRELIMMCYLKHDRADILGDAPDPTGGRVLAVRLGLGQLSQSTNFHLVQGPESRWYVESFDIQQLQQFCAKR
jgi:hypothetical protein